MTGRRIFCIGCGFSQPASLLFGPHPSSWIRRVYRWWNICGGCRTANATIPPASAPERMKNRRLARAGQGKLFS